MAVSVPAGRGRPGLQAQDGDDVTRYLCAAAYLDQRFAHDVLDELLLDPRRAVAPVPGADPVPVVRHCLAAVRQSARRDLLLTGILLAAALLTGLQGILIVIWLFSWAIVPRAVRQLSSGDAGRAVRSLVVFALLSAACLAGLLIWPDSGSSGALGLSLQSTQVLLLIVAGLWIVVYLDRIASYAVLSERLSRGRFDPGASPEPGERWADRLEYVGGVQSGNLSVYAQDAPSAPFTGFGPPVHTWSVSSRLEPSTATPAGLTAQDVYAGLRIAGQQGGYAIGDLVLMPGWLPEGHPFLEGAHQRPVPGLAAAIVQDVAAQPGGAESYHQIWTQPGAGAGSIVTGFVQVTVHGGQLAVDVALTSLPAVGGSYRAADRSEPASVLLMLRMLGAALIDAGRRAPRAPVELARSVVRAWRRRSGGSRLGAGRDLGARWGLREIAGRRDGQVQAGDYEVTRQANQLSRELAAGVARVLADLGFDPAGFSGAAGAVWQKPLRASGGPNPQAPVP